MNKLTDTEQIALRLLEINKELHVLASRLVAATSKKQPREKVPFAFAKKPTRSR